MQSNPQSDADEKQAIREVIHRFALALDLKDWELCRACFAEEVEVDYSDLRGDPPHTVKAEDFVALRREALMSLQTHHLSANHVITLQGNSATCLSSMLIFRRRQSAEDIRIFDTHCIYTHRLARTPQGWQIVYVQQQVLWNSGDSQIHAGVRTR